MCVNSWSHLVGLFWESVEPFGHGMADVMVVTVHLGYTFDRGQPSFQPTLYSDTLTCEQVTAQALLPATPFPHNGPMSSETMSQNNHPHLGSLSLRQG